jgi:AraC family transcriptional regulator
MNQQEPRIETIPAKKLIGQRLSMSLADNKTYQLWSSFMPRRKEIEHCVNQDLISMQVYDDAFNFKNFNPNAAFEKWAAVEVADLEFVPAQMETFILPPGLYAIFLHRGARTTAPKTFQYIFETWLPNSDYRLDNRPHFELLGKKYKNENPDSEEEIWIPVKPKK